VSSAQNAFGVFPQDPEAFIAISAERNGVAHHPVLSRISFGVITLTSPLSLGA
jgi:hypothetical protein